MPYFIKRLAEVFLLSIVCSAAVMMLYISEILTARIQMAVVVVISAAAFLVVNFILMRAYIFGVDSRAAYCRVNGTILILYMIISFALILTRHGYILAWLFMPVKFIDVFGVPTRISALVFYVLLAAEFIAVILQYNNVVKKSAKAAPDEDC